MTTTTTMLTTTTTSRRVRCAGRRPEAKGLWRAVLGGGLLLVSACAVQPSDGGGVKDVAAVSAAAPTARVPAASSQLDVSFLLDPRLSHGVYLGDRWVSPPTYSRVEDRGSLVVAARVHRPGDASGAGRALVATWTASDPEIVAVTPARGKQVGLAAVSEGQTEVRVASGELSRTLSLSIVRERGALVMHIRQ